MNRPEIYTQLRTELSAYRRCKPDWFKRSISQWLLRLRRVHENAILVNSCTLPDKGEPYFHYILEMAALCMKEHGVVSAGMGPPLERITRPENSNLDLVALTIEGGCRRQLPGTLADYMLRIDCRLREAFEAQATYPAMATPAYTLDAVRDVASLAALGIENKTQGE